MPDDTLIDPNSPAAGGGTGAFRSAAPAGLNPDLDRWTSPAVQGAKPMLLDEADDCGAQVQRFDPTVGTETPEARRRRTKPPAKDDDEEIGEDSDSVDWYLKSCKKRAVAAQASGVWTEHDQQLLRDAQAKMAEDIDTYGQALAKWAPIAARPAEAIHGEALVNAHAAAVLDLLKIVKKSEEDSSARSSAVATDNQRLVAKAELMSRERFQGSLFVCQRAADESKGGSFEPRLKAAITAVNNQLRDIDGLEPVHTDWMNAASSASKLDLIKLKALLKKTFELWRAAQQKWLREKGEATRSAAAGSAGKRSGASPKNRS